MLGTSSAFQDAVKTSHHAVCRCDIIQDGKVVMSIPVFDGAVTADRTAAQQRSFSASLADPTGELTPTDISSVLAPFGTRVALYRGVRVPNVVIVGELDDTGAKWATGDNNGTISDPDTGDLILGWHEE